MKPNKPTGQSGQTPDTPGRGATGSAPNEPTEATLVEKANDEMSASVLGGKRKALGSSEGGDQHPANRAKRHKISLAAQPVDLAEG